MLVSKYSATYEAVYRVSNLKEAVAGVRILKCRHVVLQCHIVSFCILGSLFHLFTAPPHTINFNHLNNKLNSTVKYNYNSSFSTTVVAHVLQNPIDQHNCMLTYM